MIVPCTIRIIRYEALKGIYDAPPLVRLARWASPKEPHRGILHLLEESLTFYQIYLSLTSPAKDFAC